MTVQAHGFESAALDTTTFPFPPPLAHRSSNRDGFEFWWGMLHFVFVLPPPDSFPAYSREKVRAKERQILERFAHATGELAESSILAGGDRVAVHFTSDGQERVESAFSSNEVTRGFAVLFRQIHTNEKSDPARFLRVREVLKQINARADDAHMQERERQIGAWAQARGRLLGHNARVLTGLKLAEEGKLPSDSIPGADGLSPQALISGYQYGDLIHWGHGRSVVEAVADDPFMQAWQRMAFLEAVTGLAHLYIGFSLVVRSALGMSSAASGVRAPDS
jgi:hypothetical protein